MSGYGAFEEASTDGFEQQERQREASKQLAVAMERVGQRFGPFLNEASDRQDFNDRVALIKPQMMKVVEATGVMPVAGVMRKVVGRQKTVWQHAASRKTAHSVGDTVYVDDGDGGKEGPATIKSIDEVFDQATIELYNQDQTVQLRDLRTAQRKTAGDLDGGDYNGSEDPTTEDEDIPEGLRDYIDKSSANDDDSDDDTGKALTPKDAWDAYLTERSTEDTAKVKTHNFASKDDLDFVAAILANDDGSTTGEPTEPNTLNDAVLDGVEKGDQGQVADNIETNSGDGSDSEGKNGKESRRKTATDWHAIGYAAYLNGESGVPTANSAVMQAIGDMPVGGGGAEIMRAYQEGWQAANAEATDMQFAGDDQSFIASVLREGK